MQAYREAHHVILILDKGSCWSTNQAALSLHQQYYNDLQQKGKLIQCGVLMNQPGMLKIVAVGSDAELEKLINNDPGIQAQVIEIRELIPFVINTPDNFPGLPMVHDLARPI